MLTRRAILPLFGAIPVTRWPIEIVPRAKETRIVFGGDVMLSRFVGRLARERRDPALPLRDLAPYFAAADSIRAAREATPSFTTCLPKRCMTSSATS